MSDDLAKILGAIMVLLVLGVALFLGATAQASEGCREHGTPGVIGVGGGCWDIGDYEALYGDPVWFINHLYELGVINEPEQVTWLIRAAWPDHLEEDAIRVAKCESGLNPRAANFTGTDLSMNGGSVGVFQQGVWFWSSRASQAGLAGSDIRDPYANAAVSAWLQEIGGWRHWSCARIVGVI